MSKMSETRKIKKGLGMRNFNAQEILELQEMQRLVNMRKFEAEQVKINTALVPRGQEIANELEAIARILENAKNHYVSQKLTECGYAKDAICDINLTDGTIILKKDEPKSDKTT